MIVCICRGVSDRDVRSAIENGAGCVETLARCGIGGDCRGCEDTLIDMIGESAGENACSSCCASRKQFATG
jgi:bacterioferritin-associated ferredoxin